MLLFGKQLKIGSRSSKLALWQADFAKSKLEKLGFGCRIEPIKTEGDKIDKPLFEFGGKGLFVKELEKALINGKIDVAVNSLKDMSVYEGDEFDFVVFERDYYEDTFVSLKGNLLDLGAGAKIGTTSLRRRAEILRVKPDVEFVDLRGNLDTRLRKLKEGVFDGIVVSKSGLVRLGLYDGSYMFDLKFMIPAAGQGVIAVEFLKGSELGKELKRLEDRKTRVCIDAERAFVRQLNASCNYPIGAYAHFDGEDFCMSVMYGCIKDLKRSIRYSKCSKSPLFVLSEVIEYVEGKLSEDFC